MKTEFDVIVVGAGINGIAAGAYLQKAGLDVAVVERETECGPFCRSDDIFGNGLPVDTCAVMIHVAYGPAWKDLELERFGLEFLYRDPSMVAVWKDKNLAFGSMNPQTTAQAIERFSEKDAKTYLRIMSKMAPDAQALMELLLFSPPSEEKLPRLWEAGKYFELSPDEFRQMNGFELMDVLFENDYTKMALMTTADMEVLGNPSLAGEGALNMILSFAGATYHQLRGGSHNIPHALVRCFKHHGGTLLLNAPVEKITYEGGVAKGVVISEESPHPEHELRARHGIIIHLSPAVALPIIGEEKVKGISSGWYRKMKEWDYTGHCSLTSHFLLKKRPAWRSAAWDPSISNSLIIYPGWDSWEDCIRSIALDHSGDVWKIAGKTGEVFDVSAVDVTRISPEGYSVLSYEVEYPPLLHKYGGVKMWNDRKFTDEIHRIHTERMEELIAGFKDLLLESTYLSCIDHWRRNASGVLGNEGGGNTTEDQWYLGRMPHRAPVAHLYFCQGTYPVGYSALSSGYVAACVVAEDLGVRNRPWWTSRPLEWLFERLQSAGS